MIQTIDRIESDTTSSSASSSKSSPSFDHRRFLERVRPLIEAHRAEADSIRRLPTELTEALRVAGAFGFTTPHEYGGAELALTTAMTLFEELGRIDGPVAWNIWNGGLGFCAALLDPDAASTIWSGSAAPIIANSARTAGAGVPASGGYSLAGRWDMVSAIDIADWVGLFGLVIVDGAPRMTAAGPDVRVFFVRAADIQVIDTWHTAGMRGTGSKTVVVDGLVVPESLAISPFTPSRIDRPLYRIPAFTLASSGSAPILVGIAQAAIDEVLSIAPTKGTDNGQPLSHRSHVHSQIAAGQTSLHGARLLLRDAAAAIDAAAAANEPVDELLRARLRAAMSHAAAVSRDVLTTCQLLASSSAVYTSNTIERLVRDGMTAAQHMILSPTHLDILGRLLCGLDAGTPIV